MLRNARYYAPQWGQFLTRDPFPGLLSHPATQAPYPYALNNPLRYTDPSGEFVETLFDLAMVGYSVYTIGDKLQRGCAVPWTEWAALGLDALSLALPFVPAGGMAIRLAAHADDLGDVARLVARSDNADIVYRVMRAEQHPAALVEGIWAKNPLKNYEPQYHVMQGNKKSTNWISTTRDIEWARQFSTPTKPIYAIDLNKVTSTVIDTTKPGVMENWYFKARVLAGRASEVLVDKYIPPEAILGIVR
ncbi:MAG: RHS repeat-associated core domain-containing protein [Bellilinea sp.]